MRGGGAKAPRCARFMTAESSDILSSFMLTVSVHIDEAHFFEKLWREVEEVLALASESSGSMARRT